VTNLFVIEDEESLLDAMTELLSDAGYNVSALDSGEAAVAALEGAVDHLPDIIVTDIRLTGMSGLELLKKARNHDLWKSIPFICLSASIPTETEEYISQHAAVVFMRKPFEIDDLYATVRHVLSQ
jgi:DNA-binding response OmpR family regulator